MLKIKILSIGKLSYKEIYETCNRFKKMISRFGQIEILEFKESNKPYPLNLEEEGKTMLKNIKGEYIILLDKKGKELSSEEFANIIKDKIDNGENIAFIIGGHQGVSEEVKQKADYILSFSKMTFGHNIFRVMLLEQIYRAFSIIYGTEYHK
ncbi:MAG: 23S rRNA (pseudouridine(1915)-N(3))-methyltransferase RlmH [Brevinematia bacterium]